MQRLKSNEINHNFDVIHLVTFPVDLIFVLNFYKKIVLTSSKQDGARASHAMHLA